jgi:tRNA-specific 2-thiouridylase
MMRIGIGMSGGVDSSVAAIILKEQRHEVFGITMRIWSGDADRTPKRHACYGPGEESEILRAGEICEAIGIPHLVYDLSKEYSETILGYFKREYLEGRTPNPCVLCNQRMKFGLLPALANDELGVNAFATGQYVRTRMDAKSGRATLLKARDTFKDQSYFLHRLTQEQLMRAVFPLGEYTKEEVRQIAREKRILSWEDPESQDFYDGDYSDLIGYDDEPGDIVDTKGTVLGKHRGIWNYTVGQRRGLGIAAAEPLYVTAIDASRKRVIVATKHESLISVFHATHFNWVSIDGLNKPKNLAVKTRSTQRGVQCKAEPLGASMIRIILENPESGIAAGQSAVLYDEDMVIGGGTIEYQ